MNRNRNTGILLLMIVTGVLIGSLIGSILAQYVPLLNFGPGPLGIHSFGLDVGIISFQLSFLIDLNLAGLIGIILAVVLFKKL